MTLYYPVITYKLFWSEAQFSVNFVPFQYSFWTPVFWHSLDMTVPLSDLFFLIEHSTPIRCHFSPVLIRSFLIHFEYILIESSSTVLILFRILVVTGHNSAPYEDIFWTMPWKIPFLFSLVEVLFHINRHPFLFALLYLCTIFAAY